MVNITNVENILTSDRIPLFIGADRFYLKKAVQDNSYGATIPNEVIKEEGNSKNRGTLIESAEVSFSFNQLSVDMDMEQILGRTYATVGSATGGLVLATAGSTVGIKVFSTGASKNITKLVVAGFSGVTGKVMVGRGSLISAVLGSSIVRVTNGDEGNFSVGDTLSIQVSGAAYNSNTASVTKISGNILTVTCAVTLSNFASAVNEYIFVNDTGISATKWTTSGIPNTAEEGFEVFNYKHNPDVLVSSGAITGGIINITAAGTSSDIDSDNWRNGSVDALLIYNDYDDNLIGMRYIPEMGATSINYNFTADGQSTESYDFTTGKSIFFTGYVLRKSMVTDSAIAINGTYDLDADSSIFEGSEAVVTISGSTSVNSKNYSINFLKLTVTSGSNVQVLQEVSSATGLKEDEYHYVIGTGVATFGRTINSGARIEATYLCQAANVTSANEYKFDSTAFALEGAPIAIPGGYQPVLIGVSTDYDDRTDGIESSTMSISFNRELWEAQGIITKRTKPSQNGEVTGTLTAKEGYNKVVLAITSGTVNTVIPTGTQVDVNKSSVYSNNNTLPIGIRLYDPYDNTTVIKTITCPAIQIESENHSVGVGNDSTMDFGFTGKEGYLNIGR